MAPHFVRYCTPGHGPSRHTNIDMMRVSFGSHLRAAKGSRVPLGKTWLY
jgi:hypothetical protein